MMSSTMSLHTSPSFATVLKQQLRLTWMSYRPLAITVLLVFALLAPGAVMAAYSMDPGLLITSMAPAVMLIAGSWGIIVWREEGPSRRTYHWSMPYDAARHDLTRAAAGAVWLFIALVAYVLVGVAIGYMAGEGEALARVMPLLLPHFFIVGFIAYFLTCTLATVSNKPLEWIIFGYLGLLVLAALGELVEQEWVMQLVNATLGKPYGLGWALVGGWRGAQVRVATPELAEVSVYYAQWLPVALGWLALSVVLLVIGARVRSARA